MRNEGRLVLGLVLLGLGILLLLSRLLALNVGAFCWPVFLILVGIWLIVRPHMVGPERRVNQRLLGDIRRRGPWTVTDEEIWIGVGDVRLDLTEAELPAYETTLRIYGGVADVDLIVPQDVGVSISSTGFLTSAKLWGEKEDVFLSTLNRRSDNYEQAERRLQVITGFFVLDLDVRRG
ncbi:MAG: cell wall-active antibiotics response protein [Chloroflexi bacterium]|nr:cell wall-active antibiotics response protein [Chloroflexota bacterium]